MVYGRGFRALRFRVLGATGRVLHLGAWIHGMRFRVQGFFRVGT